MTQSSSFLCMWLVIGALAIGLWCVIGNMLYLRSKLDQKENTQPAASKLKKVLAFAPRLLRTVIALHVLGGCVAMYVQYTATQQIKIAKRAQLWPSFEAKKVWTAPDTYIAQTNTDSELIAYGRDLIMRTQDYFGKHGIVRAASINEMNCQNCHLDAGTKPFGNNYFAVASTYPQMRARSGSLETIPKRINDCFQRSLNGQALDTTSREMLAIIAYMRFLGTGVPTGVKPTGVGLVEVPQLDRAADPALGAVIYTKKCASCHASDGAGLPMPENNGARRYPPLWGPNSYNEGAGLFRLSRLAGYVKANMPLGATYTNPQLTDAEAWDVAAFINTQPRPAHPFLATDWPKIEKKPFDHPFGPFADTFPAHQHKYGPFEPITAHYKALAKLNK